MLNKGSLADLRAKIMLSERKISLFTIILNGARGETRTLTPQDTGT